MADQENQPEEDARVSSPVADDKQEEVSQAVGEDTKTEEDASNEQDKEEGTKAEDEEGSKIEDETTKTEEDVKPEEQESKEEHVEEQTQEQVDTNEAPVETEDANKDEATEQTGDAETQNNDVAEEDVKEDQNQDEEVKEDKSIEEDSKVEDSKEEDSKEEASKEEDSKEQENNGEIKEEQNKEDIKEEDEKNDEVKEEVTEQEETAVQDEVVRNGDAECDVNEETFTRFGKNGKMDKDQFKRVLRIMGQMPTSEDANSIFDKADKDDQGEIDYREFCRLYNANQVSAEKQSDELVQCMDKVFGTNDKIQLGRVKTVMTKLALDRETSFLTKDDIEDLITDLSNQLNKSDKGEVDKLEFARRLVSYNGYKS